MELRQRSIGGGGDGTLYIYLTFSRDFGNDALYKLMFYSVFVTRNSAIAENMRVFLLLLCGRPDGLYKPCSDGH